MAEGGEEHQTTTFFESSSTGFLSVLDETGDLPLHAKVIFFMVIIPAELCNIVGNSCTLIAMIRDKKLRTPHNFYIANLAITDLIVGLFIVPFSAVLLMDNYYWRFGHLFCKIYNLFEIASVAESLWTMILLTYDRLQLVKKGALYSQESHIKSALTKLAVSWLWVLLISVPPILFYDVIRGYSTMGKGQCRLEVAVEVVWYGPVNAIVQVLAPAVLLFSLSWYVFFMIRQQHRRVNTMGGNVTHTNDLKRSTKAGRSLALIVAVFFICWMPFTTCLLIFPFCPACVSDETFQALNWLFWMKTSLNPFLYAATIPRFRLNFGQLLLPKSMATNTSIAPSSSAK